MIDPGTVATQFTRILIADTDSSVLEALPQKLHENLPHCSVDLCSSVDGAIRQLWTSPYQLIISGVHLAEMQDFFLLERLRIVQPHTPLIVTAGGADKVSATEVLKRGAFDIITKPINSAQVQSCLRLIREYERYHHLLAIEEKTRVQHEKAVTSLLTDEKTVDLFNQSRTVLLKSLEISREGIKQAEKSIRLLSSKAATTRSEAHARAAEWLKTLGR